MKVTVSLKSNLPSLESLMILSAKEITVVGATAHVEDARKQILEQVGSGVKYPGLPNTSSAPGEAPVNQSGELAASYHVEEKPDVIGIASDAVSDSPIAAIMEFGTSRIAPRPVNGPASVVAAEAMVVANEELAAKVQKLSLG